MKTFSTAAAVAFMLAGCMQATEEPEAAADAAAGTDAAPATGFTNDEERILYALGTVVAGNFAQLELSEDEFEFVADGMRDAVAGTDPRVDMNVYGPQIEMFANERIGAAMAEAAAEEKALAAAFADEVAAEAGAERLDSGVIIVPMTEGDGEMPAASDTVTVHYHGTLRDGTVFDSSVERDMPATFPLSGVIPCWTEGVQRIAVGGKAKLLCPSDTAYGDQGTGGIPGGAALLFEVELLSID
jgi:FKBP-type peptidyl-prolyl cis-trans isomerase FkpA